MKKHIITLLVFVCFSLSSVDAQIFKGQIIAGTNFSQVDGDEVYGYKKLGANVGLGVVFPISKNKRWLISLETLYNQKGAFAKRTAVDTFPERWKYRLFLDYLETPVMIHYEDKGGFTFGLGFSWGRLTSVKEYENGQYVPSTTTLSKTYTRSDVNFLADVRFRIYRGLKFNFRYAYSVMPIRDRYFAKTNHSRLQYNNMLTVRLIYVINEKKQAKRKVKDKASVED